MAKPKYIAQENPKEVPCRYCGRPVELRQSADGSRWATFNFGTNQYHPAVCGEKAERYHKAKKLKAEMEKRMEVAAG